MTYKWPTLFGVAYACRLFREIDSPSSYEEFLGRTNPGPNSADLNHQTALLDWLNKWGCRISREKYPDLSAGIRTALEPLSLRSIQSDIAELADSELDRLEAAFSALRGNGLGPTSVSKVLFAFYPNCAIPWDQPIRSAFNLSENAGGYRKMVELARNEARELISDATGYGINKADIPKAVGAKERQDSLVKLLDEYHWTTITEGHDIPGVGELEQWLSWHKIRNRNVVEMLNS